MLLTHTNIDYSTIPELPIPALHAILKNLHDEINLKRMPFMGYTGDGEGSTEEEKPYTVDDALSTLAMFSGF